MRKKTTQICPLDVKKIINKFHTLPHRRGGLKYGKFHTFFYFIFETFPKYISTYIKIYLLNLLDRQVFAGHEAQANILFIIFEILGSLRFFCRKSLNIVKSQSNIFGSDRSPRRGNVVCLSVHPCVRYFPQIMSSSSILKSPGGF